MSRWQQGRLAHLGKVLGSCSFTVADDGGGGEGKGESSPR